MLNYNQPTQPTTDIIAKLLQIRKIFTKFFPLKTKVGRPSKLGIPDIICINWLQARYSNQTLKALYTGLVDSFPDFFNLPSYCNFVISMNRSAVFLLRLIRFFASLNTAKVLVIDSTPIPVCHIRREKRHRTMKQLATKSYHPMNGWYYGIKLHLLSDFSGNIVDFCFTTAVIGDSLVLPNFIHRYRDKTYVGDSAYVSREHQRLAGEYNSTVIAKTRKNMKILASRYQGDLLNKRKIIESVNSSLKERYNLITSRARSVNGYLAHYIRSIFQYSLNGFIDNLKLV
jgi:hypothetical protein